jgi:hypothetical protein
VPCLSYLAANQFLVVTRNINFRAVVFGGTVLAAHFDAHYHLLLVRAVRFSGIPSYVVYRVQLDEICLFAHSKL